MRFFDRVKIAFNNEYLFSVLQKYAEDFLAGKDVPTQGTIGKVTSETALRIAAVLHVTGCFQRLFLFAHYLNTKSSLTEAGRQ